MRKIGIILMITALLLILCSCSSSVPEETDTSVRIAVISDIHFTGAAYRYSGSFQRANDSSGTGKQVEYLPDLVDAFIAQMLRESPDYLLLTGDNSFNGARVSHEELITRLKPLQDAGIVILTLPGNHDIHASALVFPEGEPEKGESIEAEDFSVLYADFGYGTALSRDPSSLSYVYDTERGIRFFMLDTCFRYGAVYGRLGIEKLTWLADELEACREAGDIPIIAGHHNALVHHPLFAFGYTVDDGEELRELLMKYGVTLYLSGHLHPQSITWEDGFCDIATESFAVYPHRYGWLEVQNGNWRYTAQETDVERWASESGVKDDHLLNYKTWGRSFFLDSARIQAQGNYTGVIEDEALLQALSEYFAEANVGYFMGVPCAPADGELAEAIAQLSGRTSLYLQTITSLPESLYAEGSIG